MRRWFFQQLIVGLDYCHRMGVVNRDIKLENTLLDASPKPLVKITDFGYCKASNDSLPKSKVGTPGYTGVSCQHQHCPSCLPCGISLLLHASILTLPLHSAALSYSSSDDRIVTCWATAVCVMQHCCR